MIRLSKIEKIYDGANGQVHAVKGIDLTVRRGEIFGVIGLSGAGKSSLVRCINMLERPTSGSVVVGGQELTTLSDSELREARKHIGMIFQHFNLLSSATVYDNIAFPLKLAGVSKEAIEKKVLPLLDLVGLKEKRDMYPSQLSGGQKQRVGIARALASEPKVLLCDEATSALDPQTTKSILDLLKDINEKLQLTIVIITHEMQVIKEICDKVAVIEGGQIIEQGPVLDVFMEPQQATTREFISTIISRELPTAYRGVKFHTEYKSDSRLVLRLCFLGESADDPVICSMIRHCNVEVRIMYGNIDHIKTTTYGRLMVEINGAEEDIKKSIEFLRQQDLRIEVLGYVAGHDINAD